MPTMCLALRYKDVVRVLARILFILLSKHFQLVVMYLLNGAIHWGSPQKESTLINQRQGWTVCLVEARNSLMWPEK